MATANPKYARAYDLFLESGNLAAAARTLDLNYESLRDYARRHNWERDRARHQEQRDELLQKIRATQTGLIGGFFEDPSESKLKIAKGVLHISHLLGGLRKASEEATQAYDNSRDSFREMLLESMNTALRNGDAKAAARILALIGQLDGHIGGKGPAQVPEEEPQAAAPGRYQERHPREILAMLPAEWVHLERVPEPYRPPPRSADSAPAPLADPDFLRYVIKQLPAQWLHLDQLPQGWR